MGNKLQPLSKATSVLPGEETLRLYKRNGERDILSAGFYLETARFLECMLQFLAVLKRHAPDIGEKKIEQLLARLADTMNAPEVSGGVAGLLAEGSRVESAKKPSGTRTPVER